MTDLIEFEAFPKLSRFSRDCIITEKLDGTNAQVCITEHGDILAGSRNKWITEKDDNYGFARWVNGNKDELLKLGPGRHFGEWWGAGIQRRYGLNEKRFSLFNTSRWSDWKPECCSVVPVLGVCVFDDINEIVFRSLAQLIADGSIAAPGFMDPEGIVIFHTASGTAYKKTIKDDGVPKSLVGK